MVTLRTGAIATRTQAVETLPGVPQLFGGSDTVASRAQDAAAERGHVGALERMRDELGRARRRGGRIVVAEQVQSPMDRNATLEVAAALIADCDRRAGELRAAAGLDPSGATHQPPWVVDAQMRQAANGAPAGRARRDTA